MRWISRNCAARQVLNSHDRFDVRSILGVVENPAVDGGRGTATVRFSDRPEIAGIVRDIEQGIISRVSVGYTVKQWTTSKDAAGNRIENPRRDEDACRKSVSQRCPPTRGRAPGPPVVVVLQ